MKQTQLQRKDNKNLSWCWTFYKHHNSAMRQQHRLLNKPKYVERQGNASHEIQIIVEWFQMNIVPQCLIFSYQTIGTTIGTGHGLTNPMCRSSCVWIGKDADRVSGRRWQRLAVIRVVVCIALDCEPNLRARIFYTRHHFWRPESRHPKIIFYSAKTFSAPNYQLKV